MRRFTMMMGLVVLASLLCLAWGVQAVDRRAEAAKEETIQEFRALAERAASGEEFGEILIGAGYEVDMAEPCPQEYFFGAGPTKGKGPLTQCVCDIPYPWTSAGWVKLIWQGQMPATGNAFISMIWGDPNYDLDLYVLVFPVAGGFPILAFSDYTVTNMESLSEDACLGGCPWHSGNPLSVNQGDTVYVFVYMSNMYGVSGPMTFSVCGHLEQ